MWGKNLQEWSDCFRSRIRFPSLLQDVLLYIQPPYFQSNNGFARSKRLFTVSAVLVLHQIRERLIFFISGGSGSSSYEAVLEDLMQWKALSQRTDFMKLPQFAFEKNEWLLLTRRRCRSIDPRKKWALRRARGAKIICRGGGGVGGGAFVGGLDGPRDCAPHPVFIPEVLGSSSVNEITLEDANLSQRRYYYIHDIAHLRPTWWM